MTSANICIVHFPVVVMAEIRQSDGADDKYDITYSTYFSTLYFTTSLYIQ